MAISRVWENNLLDAADKMKVAKTNVDKAKSATDSAKSTMNSKSSTLSSKKQTVESLVSSINNTASNLEDLATQLNGKIDVLDNYADLINTYHNSDTVKSYNKELDQYNTIKKSYDEQYLNYTSLREQYEPANTAYKSAVSSYNSSVTDYNSKLNDLKTKVATLDRSAVTYNAAKDEYELRSKITSTHTVNIPNYKDRNQWLAGGELRNETFAGGSITSPTTMGALKNNPHSDKNSHLIGGDILPYLDYGFGKTLAVMSGGTTVDLMFDDDTRITKVYEVKVIVQGWNNEPVEKTVTFELSDRDGEVNIFGESDSVGGRQSIADINEMLSARMSALEMMISSLIDYKLGPFMGFIAFTLYDIATGESLKAEQRISSMAVNMNIQALSGKLTEGIISTFNVTNVMSAVAISLASFGVVGELFEMVVGLDTTFGPGGQYETSKQSAAGGPVTDYYRDAYSLNDIGQVTKAAFGMDYAMLNNNLTDLKGNTIGKYNEYDVNGVKGLEHYYEDGTWDKISIEESGMFSFSGDSVTITNSEGDHYYDSDQYTANIHADTNKVSVLNKDLEIMTTYDTVTGDKLSEYSTNPNMSIADYVSHAVDAVVDTVVDSISNTDWSVKNVNEQDKAPGGIGQDTWDSYRENYDSYQSKTNSDSKSDCLAGSMTIQGKRVDEYKVGDSILTTKGPSRVTRVVKYTVDTVYSLDNSIIATGNHFVNRKPLIDHEGIVALPPEQKYNIVLENRGDMVVGKYIVGSAVGISHKVYDDGWITQEEYERDLQLAKEYEKDLYIAIGHIVTSEWFNYLYDRGICKSTIIKLVREWIRLPHTRIKVRVGLQMYRCVGFMYRWLHK